MIRLGLCCLFRDQPILFRTTTAKSLRVLDRKSALLKLARLCAANAEALLAALHYCAYKGIGCFRVNSRIMPLKTHPLHGYDTGDLPGGDEIVTRFRACGEFARKHDLRLSFHPDQFNVLNSPRPEVVAASVLEIEYQAEVAEWVGADVINIHAGGAFGDKLTALSAFVDGISRLSSRARSRLTVENDDRIYSPSDILAMCRGEGLPLVYDVHHHRCNRDALTVEEATEQSLLTWDREPLFHISSPIEGWDGPHPERHHAFIDLNDFPACWSALNLTVEVEAKAKEVAVLDLKSRLSMRQEVCNGPSSAIQGTL